MGDLVTNTLAAELMGRYSNLVLIQSGKIIDALKRVDFGGQRDPPAAARTAVYAAAQTQ